MGPSTWAGLSGYCLIVIVIVWWVHMWTLRSATRHKFSQQMRTRRAARKRRRWASALPSTRRWICGMRTRAPPSTC
eukprot:3836517-Prymnesium_polylepis.1